MISAPNKLERLVFYCRTTSASTHPEGCAALRTVLVTSAAPANIFRMGSIFTFYLLSGQHTLQHSGRPTMLKLTCWGCGTDPKQGYLAHKKQRPPRILQEEHTYGPMVVLWGGAVSYERGFPVTLERKRNLRTSRNSSSPFLYSAITRSSPGVSHL